MQHMPRPGEIPTDMTEFRSRYQGGVGGGGGRGPRGPRFKLGCGWQLLIGFVVMTLLTWVVIPLLRILLGW